MKTNIYILSMLSLIFMISCKDDDPVTTDPTDPTDPVAVQGCTDPTASNYDADATEDDGSCITDSGVFYQLPDLNTGVLTFEEDGGVVYGPSALADGSFDPDYEFKSDNLDGHWGAFGGDEEDAPEVSYVENPDKNVNDSDTVIKMVKKGGAAVWSGIFFDLENPLVFPAGKEAISIDLWSPAAGVEVTIKLENSFENTDTENFKSSGNMSALAETTIDGGWETFVFNVPESVDFDVTRFVLIPSIKVANAEDVTYYLDNIDFAEPGIPPVTEVSYNLSFIEAFGGTTIDSASSTYTFPAGADSWGGFANMNADIYPISLSSDMEVRFTGAAPSGDVDVRFRFEYNPHPDTEPSYNTVAVTVSGADEKTYSVPVPSQGPNTFSSVIMYLDTQDVGVVVKDPKIVLEYDLGLSFIEAFGGTTIDSASSTYTFPAGADSWGGFANMNADIYPISLSSDMEVRFTGAAPSGDVDVRFRFEYNPHPDTEPSYNTVAVTVSGADEKTYSVPVPSQGPNTFSSVIMYLDTQDVGVVVKDVGIHNASPAAE